MHTTHQESSSNSHGDQDPRPLVIFTVGVTASGKTTWANQTQKEHPNLDIAIIPTPEAKHRARDKWLKTIRANLGKNVIIMDGSNLDTAQIQDDMNDLQKMGITDIAIEYFNSESLFILLRRNGGRDGEKIRDELQRIQNKEKYLKIADSFDA